MEFDPFVTENVRDVANVLENPIEPGAHRYILRLFFHLPSET